MEYLAVEDIKKYGSLQGRKTVFEIKPLVIYSSTRIKQIREKTGLSQSVFAKAIGVSKKTVEAWEAGINTPSGVALRMLELIDRDKISIEDCFFSND